MKGLLDEIRRCQICAPHLKDGVNPILSAHQQSRIAIIGQAPGSAVHQSGIPWDDPSGKRLREWMAIDHQRFYDPKLIAIIPMGFCYPGKGKSGDLPPRPECAPQWHPRLFDQLTNLDLIILIGAYSQQYYLMDKARETLTKTVQNFRAYLPTYFVLPHPSPRNNIWMKKNPWFEAEVIPELQSSLSRILKN